MPLASAAAMPRPHAPVLSLQVTKKSTISGVDDGALEETMAHDVALACCSCRRFCDAVAPPEQPATCADTGALVPAEPTATSVARNAACTPPAPLAMVTQDMAGTLRDAETTFVSAGTLELERDRLARPTPRPICARGAGASERGQRALGAGSPFSTHRHGRDDNEENQKHSPPVALELSRWL